MVANLPSGVQASPCDLQEPCLGCQEALFRLAHCADHWLTSLVHWFGCPSRWGVNKLGWPWRCSEGCGPYDRWQLHNSGTRDDFLWAASDTSQVFPDLFTPFEESPLIPHYALDFRTPNGNEVQKSWPPYCCVSSFKLLLPPPEVLLPVPSCLAGLFLLLPPLLLLPGCLPGLLLRLLLLTCSLASMAGLFLCFPLWRCIVKIFMVHWNTLHLFRNRPSGKGS